MTRSAKVPMRRALIAAFVIVLPAVASAETLNLYAAGSLRAALTDVTRAFEAKNRGLTVEAEFAASGLLRERIEKGEVAHVFAYADLGHPKKLADELHGTLGNARERGALRTRRARGRGSIVTVQRLKIRTKRECRDRR